MSYIQLPDKIVNNVEQIQLNLPKDQKAKDLLAHLPYIANLQDPILQNRVEDLLKNREDLQKNLLATEFLGKTLEDSLELAVSHGKLNEGTKVRHLSELNNPKYKYFRQNNNPLDVAYRDKAKFDVQNPIIGDLLKKINKGKLSEEEYFKKTKTAPDIKDLDIKERFDKLFERSDGKKKDNFLDNDNNVGDSPPGSPGLPPPPPMDFDFDEDPNPYNADLNNLEREYYARDIPIQDKRQRDDIQLDTNLQEIFPDADEVLYENEASRIRQQYYPFTGRVRKENEYPWLRKKNEIFTEPDNDDIPQELEFFSGGAEQASSLFSRLDSRNLIRANEDFVNFLGTEECQEALQRDGISIYVPTGNIFVNNQNTEESIYTFLDNQQEETKKEIPLDFSYDDNLTDYMTKYLPAINDYDEVKYDFLANKNSKFLFNLFNEYQQDRGRKKQSVRHTKVSADDYALQKLQDKNWPCFINRIIEFSQGVFDINDIITTDADEANILNNTRSNFEIVKNLYNELLTSVEINLHEYFMNLDIDKKKKIDTDLTNNNYFTWDPHESFIQTRILATYRDFFYETGRFPGRNTLIHVPMANMRLFLNATDWISPRSLYETYVGRDMQGVTSVQFLAAFNRFLGGDKEISRNAISEFFHNLSWQALTNDNDSIQIEFKAITELVKSINLLLLKKKYESKRRTALIKVQIQNKILSKEPEILKTNNEIVEQKIVSDILNNNNIDYTPQYNFPTVKTDEEVERDRINENTNYIATELVKKKERYPNNRRHNQKRPTRFNT